MREDVDINKAYITIYSTDGSRMYAFYNNRASELNNILDSCTVTGGPNEPFEYVEIRIPRKKLAQMAPELTKEGAIVDGVNKMYMSAMGTGMYIVMSGGNVNSDTRVIKAYCQAYKLRGTFSSSSLTMKPFEMIEEILLNNGQGGPYITGKLKYWFTDRVGTEDVLTFDVGSNLWSILQICAMYLGCKIFFSGNDAYLIDYRLSHGDLTIDNGVGTDDNIGFKCTVEPVPNADGKSSANYPDALYDFDTINLYTKDSSRAEYGRVVGTASLGNEGQDTNINNFKIVCADGVTVTVEDKASIEKYGSSSNDPLNIPQLLETNLEEKITGTIFHQGLRIASNIVSYRSETQQSISFKMKEFVKSGGVTHWLPFFPPGSRVKGITDSSEEIDLGNTSVFNDTVVKPHKLLLSSYERHFPEGLTTYSFGILKNIDLSEAIYDLTADRR